MLSVAVVTLPLRLPPRRAHTSPAQPAPAVTGCWHDPRARPQPGTRWLQFRILPPGHEAVSACPTTVWCLCYPPLLALHRHACPPATPAAASRARPPTPRHARPPTGLPAILSLPTTCRSLRWQGGSSDGRSTSSQVCTLFRTALARRMLASLCRLRPSIAARRQPTASQVVRPRAELGPLYPPPRPRSCPHPAPGRCAPPITAPSVCLLVHALPPC